MLTWISLVYERKCKNLEEKKAQILIWLSKARSHRPQSQMARHSHIDQSYRQQRDLFHF